MAMTCTDQPCSRPVRGRGLCGTHYAYRRRHGTLPSLVWASGCKAEDCPGVHEAKGLCKKHYQRLRKRGSLEQPVATGSDEERFWAKVDRSGGPDACWPWLAKCESTGYGRVWWNGKSELAHRVAYMLTKGLIPEGLHIDHLCRNRPCCNPRDIEAVTQTLNNQRTPLTPQLRARRAAAGRKGAAARWGLDPKVSKE